MIQNVDPEPEGGPEGGPKGVPVLGVQKGVQFQGPQGDLVWGSTLCTILQSSKMEGKNES